MKYFDLDIRLADKVSAEYGSMLTAEQVFESIKSWVNNPRFKKDTISINIVPSISQ